MPATTPRTPRLEAIARTAETLMTQLQGPTQADTAIHAYRIARRVVDDLAAAGLLATRDRYTADQEGRLL